MRIKKIFNNNAVLVDDQGKEKIVTGAGIGFQKKVYDLIPESKIEKIFESQTKGEYEAYKKILETIPIEHIKISERIISHAEDIINKPLNKHIYVVLTDHISFAIDRAKSGIKIRNKLLNEIKMLYKDDFEIGIWAINMIKKELNVDLPVDEAGYIAIHIHTAYSNSTLEESTDIALIIRDLVDIVQGEMNVTIEDNTLSYERLVTHLRFALQRKENGNEYDDLDQELISIIKLKYKEAYACALKIKSFLKQSYDIEFGETELSYIALHIQRITNIK